MALITSKITYYRSTTEEFEVNITPPSGDTATKVFFTVKEGKYDDSATDTTAIVKKDVTLTSDSGSFTITDTDIDDSVEPGKKYYSMHVVFTNAGIKPLASGVFELVADSTNRAT